MKNRKLLIIGGLPNEKYCCRYGGATVLMKNLLDYLGTHKYCYRFVQTNKFINTKTLELRPILNKVYFIVCFIFSLPWSEIVMFNFSDHATIRLFPTLSKVSHLLGKKVVIRKFGGSLNLALSKITQQSQARVINALSEADAVFFETKAAISHLKAVLSADANIHWFPNVRKSHSYRKDYKTFNKKIVFMSHVSDEKGVMDLLSVAEQLGREYSVDIYGSIKEEKYINFEWSKFGVTYHGQISSENVIKNLLDYDFLMLPSYREGYPGIIIEALSVGLPVVSTCVGGIPEMINHGHEGFLIVPGDINSYIQCIKSVDEANYHKYSQNAYKTFVEKFDADCVNHRVISTILAL